MLTSGGWWSEVQAIVFLSPVTSLLILPPIAQKFLLHRLVVASGVSTSLADRMELGGRPDPSRLKAPSQNPLYL